ncbi:MAG: PhzF family phenazine biosynthesis protein [Bacteroidota bacterium]
MTSPIPVYQIDAFTDRPFAGNPAAVCPIDEWLPDALLQSIAAENNLSETAFLVREGGDFRIRWFTPTVEVDLCGHATLASAFVVFTEIDPGRQRVVFASRSGPLVVVRRPAGLVMDFPAWPPHPIAPPDGLAAALGATPVFVLAARDLLAVFDDAATVRQLRPDMTRLAALDKLGVAVTAPGTGADGDVDFVSRFFAPRAGIPEDPVTGSAHCSLTPYWATRLGRDRLFARQVSARGGSLDCTLRGDRVDIGGRAVLVMRGNLLLP